MLQWRKRGKENGFTLIELMIVIAIIGILAAIAIPNFVSYRQRAYDSTAKGDMKNMMTAQEAYFIDWDAYRSGTATNGAQFANPNLSLSSGVTMEVEGSVAGYTITTYHASGTVTWTVRGPAGNMWKASGS